MLPACLPVLQLYSTGAGDDTSQWSVVGITLEDNNYVDAGRWFLVSLSHQHVLTLVIHSYMAWDAGRWFLVSLSHLHVLILVIHSYRAWDVGRWLLVRLS